MPKASKTEAAGAKINLAQAIREAVVELQRQEVSTGPAKIAEILRTKYGISTSPSYISYVKSTFLHKLERNTLPRQRPITNKPQSAIVETQSAGLTPEDIRILKLMANRVGGLAVLRDFIDALMDSSEES